MFVDLVAGNRYRPVPAASRRFVEPMSKIVPAENEPAKILVFDSGLGGLTVLSEVSRLRPDADCIYAADDAGFPYGAWAADALKARVVDVVGRLIAEIAPDCVVVACNTASTLVLPELRAAFPGLPFVGTVPAIKPAAAVSRSKLISVLATPGTVARDYTRALVDSFATDCTVTLVGSSVLAGLAEAVMAGVSVTDAAIVAEITPCFVEASGARTDAIVLACTHYPLLRPRFEALAPWPVAWIDPAPAIARRVDSVLRESGFDVGPARSNPLVARFTSGREATPCVSRALSAMSSL